LFRAPKTRPSIREVKVEPTRDSGKHAWFSLIRPPPAYPASDYPSKSAY
jgi:hypothetical protein